MADLLHLHSSHLVNKLYSLSFIFNSLNHVIGEDVVVKLTGHDVTSSSKGVGVLQVWSTKWSCYVDVSDLAAIGEGDRITVLVQDGTQKSSTEVCSYINV